MLRTRVDYTELVSRKSCFVNRSESRGPPLLLFDLFVNSLINERMKKREYYASSTLLLLVYSFINFYRRAKTNFIGSISRLCVRLFHATRRSNTEMTSYTLLNHQMTLQGQMLDATVQRSCVHFECMLLCFLQRVPIE